MGAQLAPSGARLLRPHASLYWQGLIAVLAFMTPVFVVLYFLTVPNGPWIAVVVTQAIASVIILIASVRYLQTAIWVSPEGITERGYFGVRRFVPVGEITSIVLAETFDSSGHRTYPQLFVSGPDGGVLVRMRGQFWSRDNMDTVVATLDVPHEKLDETLSTSDLRDERPGLLYWFERRPVFAALLFTLSTAVLGGLVYLVLKLAGIA